MMPDSLLDGSFTKDIDINCESNVWSTAQGYKKIYGFDDHVGFMLNHRSVSYVKQCSLVWSCVEERGCLCFE